MTEIIIISIIFISAGLIMPYVIASMVDSIIWEEGKGDTKYQKYLQHEIEYQKYLRGESPGPRD